MNKRRNVCIVFLVLVIALCAFAGATHADAAHIIKGDTKTCAWFNNVLKNSAIIK